MPTRMRGDQGCALQSYEKAHLLFSSAKDMIGQVVALHGCCLASHERGEIGNAKAYLKEAITMFYRAKLKTFENDALCHICEGAGASAKTHAEAAISLSRSMGSNVDQVAETLMRELFLSTSNLTTKMRKLPPASCSLVSFDWAAIILSPFYA
jgi:Tfp pilus assembly protein PilF